MDSQLHFGGDELCFVTKPVNEYLTGDFQGEGANVLILTRHRFC